MRKAKFIFLYFALFLAKQVEAETVLQEAKFNSINPYAHHLMGRKVIVDMPYGVSNQGMAGWCHSFAVAALVDFHRCKRSAADCRTIKEGYRTFKTSPIDIARFNLFNSNSYTGKYTLSDFQELEPRMSGGAQNILNGLNRIGSVAEWGSSPSQVPRGLTTENGYSYDFEKIRSLYQLAESDPKCKDKKFRYCMPIYDMAPHFHGFYPIRLDLDTYRFWATSFVSMAENKIMPAFLASSGSFPRFIKRALLGGDGKEGFMTTPYGRDDEENRIKIPRIQYTVYGNSKTTTQELKNIIRGALDGGEPLYAGVGAGMNHAFIINGYQKLCNPSTKECVDAIKIHNSWGEDWQRKNNDGWVLADDLLIAGEVKLISLSMPPDPEETAEADDLLQELVQ